MTKEFNLSDKIEICCDREEHLFVRKRYIKEAVKILKEEIGKLVQIPMKELIDEKIDKIFGEKLI